MAARTTSSKTPTKPGRSARQPKVTLTPEQEAQARVVTWASAHGAPLLMLEGWDPDTGIWLPSSPVGKMMAMVSRGSHPTRAAAVVGLNSLNRLLARGAEYSVGAPENRDFIPIDVRPLIDLARQVQFAEALHEYTLVDIVQKGAKDDPKLALAMLGRRYGERWREQQSVFATELVDERDRAVSALIEMDPNTAMQLAKIADQVESLTDRDV